MTRKEQLEVLRRQVVVNLSTIYHNVQGGCWVQAMGLAEESGELMKSSAVLEKQIKQSNKR